MFGNKKKGILKFVSIAMVLVTATEFSHQQGASCGVEGYSEHLQTELLHPRQSVVCSPNANKQAGIHGCELEESGPRSGSPQAKILPKSANERKCKDPASPQKHSTATPPCKSSPR